MTMTELDRIIGSQMMRLVKADTGDGVVLDRRCSESLKWLGCFLFLS